MYQVAFEAAHNNEAVSLFLTEALRWNAVDHDFLQKHHQMKRSEGANKAVGLQAVTVKSHPAIDSHLPREIETAVIGAAVAETRVSVLSLDQETWPLQLKPGGIAIHSVRIVASTPSPPQLEAGRKLESGAHSTRLDGTAESVSGPAAAADLVAVRTATSSAAATAQPAAVAALGAGQQRKAGPAPAADAAPGAAGSSQVSAFYAPPPPNDRPKEAFASAAPPAPRAVRGRGSAGTRRPPAGGGRGPVGGRGARAV